jgi:hypothetical protein
MKISTLEKRVSQCCSKEPSTSLETCSILMTELRKRKTYSSNE